MQVPLYRIGAVDALLAHPVIDWEQVRATGKGERSPLLALFGGRRPTRARVIRAFLTEFGAAHQVEMWAWWLNGPGKWEIAWERPDGGPTRDDVAAAIAAQPGMRAYRDDVVLHSRAGAAIRFARAMLEPGASHPRHGDDGPLRRDLRDRRHRHRHRRRPAGHLGQPGRADHPRGGRSERAH